MKIKLLAVASMVTMGLFAQTNSWFDAKIDSYTSWPTNNAAEFKGSWTNTTAATLVDKALKVSTSTDTPLTFSATTKKSISAAAQVTVKARLTFTPFTALPSVPENAKAGVIAYSTGSATNFYVIAKDPAGTTNVWTATSIAASESADVSVLFLNGSNVVYAIDAAVSTNAIKTIDSVQNACAAGEGAIASLSATYLTTGPQTPAEGGGSVKPVEGQENVYEVTSDASSHTVTIVEGTLESTDVIRITETNDVTVTGVPADQIEVVLGGTNVANSVFVGGDANSFSTKLDSAGSATVGGETIKVQPELSATGDKTVSGEAVEPFVLDDSSAAVGVKTIPGLTYRLIRQTEPGVREKEVASKRATEGRTKLVDDNKPADKAFYIIEVTK